jgi:uncharacterized membrane protein
MKITEMIQGKIGLEQRQILWQDFRLILLGAIVLFLLLVLGEGLSFLRWLRILLGLAYILLIPGYCLTMALFPRRNELSRLDRLGLSIGLSVACVSILAPVLDRTQWGIRFWSILLGEYGVTILLIAMTIWRRSLLPPEEIYISKLNWQPILWWNSLPPLELRSYKILIIGLLLILGLTAWMYLTPENNASMTEFYMLGKDGMAANYPYEVRAKENVPVTVGVVNQEKSEFNYHVEVWLTNGPNPEDRVLLTQSHFFLLQPGEKYEQAISWYMPSVGNDQEVEILLFYNDDITPSRQLRFWINVEN